MEQIIEKTLKELKAELVELGMPVEEVDTFNTKAQILAVINTMKAKKVVERVDSLEDKESPKEIKEFDQRYNSKAEVMRNLLEGQLKVRILLPLSGEEKQGNVEWRTDKHGRQYQYVVSGSYDTVQLNGCKWIIPKGVYADVPQQVAEVLNKSYEQTAKAGQDISMDRTDPRTGRPMSESL